jgi:hypothetical protein
MSDWRDISTAPKINLNELVRLQKALTRFSAAFEHAYPGVAAGDIADRLDDASETIRNAETALGYVRGWLTYRRTHGTDPFGP